MRHVTVTTYSCHGHASVATVLVPELRLGEVSGAGLSYLLGKSEIAGSTPALAFKFQRNKMFLLHSFVKI